MYNINPNNSFAHNYQVGHGEDQVLDTSVAANALHQKVAIGESDRLAKAKKLEDAKKRTSDLLNKNIGGVRPADIPQFQQKTKDYRDAVLKAFKDGGGDISPEKEAELNQIHNSNMMEALASQKKGEQDAINLNDIDKNPNDYRPLQKQKVHDAINTPSENGDYTPNSGATPIFDLQKNVVEQSVNNAQAWATKNTVDGVTKYDENHAVADARAIGKDPRVAADFHQQFTEEPENRRSTLEDTYFSPVTKNGTRNPSYVDAKRNPEQAKAINEHIAQVEKNPDSLNSDDIQAITAHHFTDAHRVYGRTREPKLSKWEVEGAKPPKQTVAGVLKTVGDGKKSFQFEYTNNTDNPFITIPQKPTLDKETGQYTQNPPIEVKPYRIDYNGSHTTLKVLTKPYTDENGDKHGGNEVSLNYSDVKDIMHNKFGIDNVFNLLDPKQTPKHVRVTRSEAVVDNNAKKDPLGVFK